MSKPLKELIHGCKQCPLYSQMGTSPVAPEWRGDPRNGLMIILTSNISAEQDLMQEIVYGIDRAGLLKVLKEFTDDWYITNYMKCCPAENHNYRVGQIQACSSWIDEEINRLTPGLIIGFGKKAEKYKCDYYLPSLNNVLNNGKKIKEFKSILEEFYNE